MPAERERDGLSARSTSPDPRSPRIPSRTCRGTIGGFDEGGRADDGRSRVRCDRRGPIRIRRSDPHAHPEPDVRTREPVGRVRGARDRGAVAAVRASAVGTAAHPAVGVRDAGSSRSTSPWTTTVVRPCSARPLIAGSPVFFGATACGGRGGRREQQRLRRPRGALPSVSQPPAAEPRVQPPVEVRAPTSVSDRGHCHPSLVASSLSRSYDASRRTERS